MILKTNFLSLFVFFFFFFFLLQFVANAAKDSTAAAESHAAEFLQRQSHNNWAVLVCTSRFWFNYRHIANTLALYRTVKRLGIPDQQIILMLADDVACNPRNKLVGTVYHNANREVDLYGSSTIEVDYRGNEVTVENFLRLLTGRHAPEVPRSKRLLTDERSNVLVYMTGHGGDEFLKFQDAEEISSHDIADAVHQMFEKNRYNELLFMVDTCQANSLYTRLYSPRVLAAGSSERGENSYSHHMSSELGVAVIDRFTFHLLDFMERFVNSMTSQSTLSQMFSTMTYDKLMSHHGVRTDLFPRRMDQVLITDFFGHVPIIVYLPYRHGIIRKKKNESTMKTGARTGFKSTWIALDDKYLRELQAERLANAGLIEQWYEFSIGALFRLRDQLRAAHQAFMKAGAGEMGVPMFSDASLLQLKFRGDARESGFQDDDGSVLVFRGLVGVMLLLVSVSALR